ncbi:MAG TPA: YgaP-like transmembrane domain [Bryobacteraceae bacterium]|nr:YgaP-like transmembrane domain [Bryobacteraceae bacterium]
MEDTFQRDTAIGDVEQKVRLAVGSAAAAAAIFAPLSYKWKGVLTAVAADAILTGIYGISPIKRLCA